MPEQHAGGTTHRPPIERIADALERIAAASERQADASEAMTNMSGAMTGTLEQLAADQAEDKMPSVCRAVHPSRSLGCVALDGHNGPHVCYVFGKETVRWTDAADLPFTAPSGAGEPSEAEKLRLLEAIAAEHGNADAKYGPVCTCGRGYLGGHHTGCPIFRPPD